MSAEDMRNASLLLGWSAALETGRMTFEEYCDHERALAENDDQRDYAEERFNAQLLREE